MMKNTIRQISARLKIEAEVRQAWVELRLTGERINFARTGRPPADSAIVLAGSARSGTTWISNILTAIPGVQPIFEPLFPVWNPDVRAITGWGSESEYALSYFLRPDGAYPAWRDLWQKILDGRCRNYWTDYERTAWFPDRFLVKEIRANLMLGFLYRQFQPRIVFILRHPGAVIASRLSFNPPWRASVRDILVQEELVETYLRPWLAKVEDEKDLLGAHAVWWALENRVARDQLMGCSHYAFHYETAVAEPERVAREIYAWLGGPPVEEEKLAKLLHQPSRMSASSEQVSSSNRLSSWKKKISVEDQQRILQWADRLGVDDYDENGLRGRADGM